MRRMASKTWIAIALATALAGAVVGVSADDKISQNGKEITSGPFKGTKVSPSGTISIVFEPHEHCSVCSKIVFIQVVRRTSVCAEGSWLLPGGVPFPLMPSAITPTWAYKDKVTIPSEGKSVDFLEGEKDPYYNGDDPEDGAAKPKENAPGKQQQGYKENPVRRATMRDTPNIPVPDGADRVILDFETAAFCAEGPDRGHFFGTVNWRYDRGKGEQASVTIRSASSVTGPPDLEFLILDEQANVVGDFRMYSMGAAGQPSQNFFDALNKWLDHYNFTFPGTVFGLPVPKELPEGPPPEWWGGYFDDVLGPWVIVQCPGVARKNVGFSVVPLPPEELIEDRQLESLGLRASGLPRWIDAADWDELSLFDWESLFVLPIVMTLTYTDAEVEGLHEETVGMGIFDWETGSYTTDGIRIHSRDTDENRITFSTRRLGILALVGSPTD